MIATTLKTRQAVDQSKSSQAPLLVVENLCVSYPGAHEPSIKNVSFELKPQTITMLIGPNGSGKSTLLKALIGVLPYQGTIDLAKSTSPGHQPQHHQHPQQHQHEQHHNQQPSSKNVLPLQPTETDLGYVPQRLEFDLSLPVTVNDFLTLALLGCHHSFAEKESFIVSALEKVGSLPLRHRPLGSLSGGQRQRVILARALIHNPRLLVLDEPEAGIDTEGEQAVYQLLKSLVESKNLTVIIASHELEAVHRYADQVLCINKSLVCAGLPKEALTEASFKKLYGSTRTIYTHHHL